MWEKGLPVKGRAP